MKNRKYAISTLSKYFFLQLPELCLAAVILLLLHTYLALQWKFVWLIFILLLFKDAALYPFVWKSYASSHVPYKNLLGKQGVAIENIAPNGYGRVDGELWRIELVSSSDALHSGDTFVVERIDGLTLLVKKSINKERIGYD